MYVAWQHGDREAALSVATGTATEDLFTHQWIPSFAAPDSCRAEAGSYSCFANGHQGDTWGITFDVALLQEKGYRVTKVEISELVLCDDESPSSACTPFPQ
jgi:hypothetical protein